MTAYNKIGFHCGPGGNPTGIGDYMRALDSAGIPMVLKSVDHYGPIFEAQELMKKSGVPHVLIFRKSNNHSTGQQFDTPNYNTTPQAAALAHWLMTKTTLPPEFDKQRVWLEVINEVDRNLCDWLGHFAIQIANLAQAEGYKVSLFGWAGGEPEPEGWEEPGMLAYLRLCAERPSQAAVAIHEYSFAGDFLKSRKGGPGSFVPAETFADGRLVGRFRELFGVCDRHGIARPTVHITEFGWALNHLPTPETAVTQLDEASRMYAQYPEVQGAAIWYLGAWDNDMPNKTQRLIAPVTDYTLNTQHQVQQPAPGLHYRPDGLELTYPNDTPVDPPDGGDMDCNPRAPYAREYYVVPQDANLARYLEVAQQAYAGRKTLAFSYDDAGHAPGVTSNTAVLYDIPDAEHQEFIDWYAEHYPATAVIFAGDGGTKPPDPEPEPGSPLDGLKLGQLFTAPYVRTSAFNEPRDYSKVGGKKDDKHEGADFDVIGTNPNSKELVLCTYDGTVERSLDSTGGYGKYVRVVHTRNGRQFYTRYCHLDTRVVQVGQVIKAGQPVGEIGTSGNVSGEHVHFNLEVPGFGLSGYVVADVVDPVPYLPNPTTPPPPATGPARIGLHSSADPGDLFGGEAEFAEFTTLFPGVIKVLSATSETAVRRLAVENPGAEWIVRAFLQWGGRNVTPQNFFDWTKDDTLRTVNALRSLGIKDSSIHIELHNEPNLALEGWGSTWADGTGFNAWLLEVLKKYLVFIPNVSYLYPGLSPGGAIPGVRYDSGAFLNQSLPAAHACDGVALHAYWSDPFPIGQAYAHIDAYVAIFGSKPLWVTEASRNDRPATKTPLQYANEYFLFWKELKKRPSVQGVTFFVASGSDPYFQPECWVVNKQSRGIAAEIKRLKG